MHYKAKVEKMFQLQLNHFTQLVRWKRRFKKELSVRYLRCRERERSVERVTGAVKGLLAVGKEGQEKKTKWLADLQRSQRRSNDSSHAFRLIGGQQQPQIQIYSLGFISSKATIHHSNGKVMLAEALRSRPRWVKLCACRALAGPRRSSIFDSEINAVHSRFTCAYHAEYYMFITASSI